MVGLTLLSMLQYKKDESRFGYEGLLTTKRFGFTHHSFSGFNPAFSPASSSHLIAAARVGKRFLKRKSSTFFRSSGSITKLR